MTIIPIICDRCHQVVTEVRINLPMRAEVFLRAMAQAKTTHPCREWEGMLGKGKEE